MRYLLAFFLCLLLTLGAYFASSPLLIAFLAILQASLILFLFLNPTKERWNLLVFLFMLLVVVILVGGTLWIMSNLDYNLMGT